VYRTTGQSLVALLAVGSLNFSLAAEPALGLAMARGTFRLDNSLVQGSATVLEGARLETERASLEVQLNSGARLGLAPASRGQFYRDRLVLERGLGELRSGSGYAVEASGLRVVPAEPQALARVAFDKDSRVLVAALNGLVRVSTREGILLANLPAGRTLAFSRQQPGAAPPVVVRGRLEQREGHYLLTDETSNVTFEVIGAELDKQVGQRVELTGILDPTAKPFPPASQVLKITRATRLGAAVPPAAAGLSTGAKVAIIAGVTVAAVVGGLAAAGVFAGPAAPVSP